jgi:hypothetical protein
MHEPETTDAPPRRRRLPVGLLVVAGSILASFIWWLSMKPAAPTVPAEPAPVASEPAPVPETAATPEPAAPRPASPKPREIVAAPAPAEVPAPPPARPLLRVTGDVAGADVFIDRTFVGKTPFESRDVAAGPHQINISKEGYDGISQRVEILADAPTEFTFALKAVTLDAGVDVVHKHRLGSCEGRLTATVHGLRYQPKSGDDAFESPLAGLESFAVEYKQKQLKVKIKGGKSYNFTTRAANADPLLVFHRDVEKARARLGAT